MVWYTFRYAYSCLVVREAVLIPTLFYILWLDKLRGKHLRFKSTNCQNTLLLTKYSEKNEIVVT